MEITVQDLFKPFFGTRDVKRYIGKTAKAKLVRADMIVKLNSERGKLSNVETRVAYATIMKECNGPKERHTLRILMGICKSTHYNWIRVGKDHEAGTLKVRSCLTK